MYLIRSQKRFYSVDKQVLDTIIQAAHMLKQEKKVLIYLFLILKCQLSPFLAQVLVYELLFGKRDLQKVGGKYTKMIMKHKTRLVAELARIKIKKKVHRNEDLIPESIRNAVVLPRYIRVNTLNATVEEVVNEFKAKGYQMVDFDQADQLKYDDCNV